MSRSTISAEPSRWITRIERREVVCSMIWRTRVTFLPPTSSSKVVPRSSSMNPPASSIRSETRIVGWMTKLPSSSTAPVT